MVKIFSENVRIIAAPGCLVTHATHFMTSKVKELFQAFKITFFGPRLVTHPPLIQYQPEYDQPSLKELIAAKRCLNIIEEENTPNVLN